MLLSRDGLRPLIILISRRTRGAKLDMGTEADREYKLAITFIQNNDDDKYQFVDLIFVFGSEER